MDVQEKNKLTPSHSATTKRCEEGNVIAIVGRPNVGKSTLFNRLIGSRQSIVDDLSGITRNRHYADGDWSGCTFTLIDTGGYTTDKELMANKISAQVKVAIEEAHLILFVVDCKQGLVPEDMVLAEYLRKSEKSVLVVANKVDNPKKGWDAHEFHGLGLGDIHTVSAAHGNGTGDLLDAMLPFLSTHNASEEQDHQLPKIAFIGRPNVGKSTFVNALLGKTRSLVDAQPHTTRSPVNCYYHFYNKELILVDTAGIAKKNQISAKTIEFYALIRAIKVIEKCDVCVVLLDAQEGLTSQDKSIIHLAHRKKKGIVLLVNKWDLVEKDEHSAVNYRNSIREDLGFIRYIPILFTSGLKKKNIYQTLTKALEVYENKHHRISTQNLINIIQQASARKQPPRYRNKAIKMKFATQTKSKNPTFVIGSNLPTKIPTDYKRYLTNQIRIFYRYEGVPITLLFKKY
ncbi:MAG: ribosome biogenesis GTPase Der [Bacteroidota bacterium]